MDLGLADRVYLVTGGTRGLGRASAEVLVDEGARVVVSSRTAAAVDSTVAALGEQRAAGLAADLSAPSTAEQLVQLALERFGRLDGALISVGGPAPGAVVDIDDDAWRDSFESVFLGAVRLARTVLPHLGEGGALAFVLSTSVISPVPGLAVSSGLRPGLAMVAKQLADEVGPDGVRVNGLLPGHLETGRVRELHAATGDAEAARARTLARVPLGRLGDPAEFGRVAAFLLSPAASYITGSMIAVDGGSVRSL